jgi:hypothetical protein
MAIIFKPKPMIELIQEFMQICSMYPMHSQGRALYHGSEIPPWSVNRQTSYATNKSTEHDLKLHQLEELMYKNFPPLRSASRFT